MTFDVRASNCAVFCVFEGEHANSVPNALPDMAETCHMAQENQTWSVNDCVIACYGAENCAIIVSSSVV
jgi:hypothetical protein